MRGLLGQLGYTLWALWNPQALRPTYTARNLSELVVPSSTKIIILDKDNTFAKPHEITVWPALRKYWDTLVKKNKVAVLSNTSGDLAADPEEKLADELEKSLQVPVIRHQTKKPVCYRELRKNLAQKGIDPQHVLVVGDRLVTDVLLANLLGAPSVWIRPGIHPNWMNKLENFIFDVFTS